MSKILKNQILAHSTNEQQTVLNESIKQNEEDNWTKDYLSSEIINSKTT